MGAVKQWLLEEYDRERVEEWKTFLREKRCPCCGGEVDDFDISFSEANENPLCFSCYVEDSD
jgi:hypothetical protein